MALLGMALATYGLMALAPGAWAVRPESYRYTAASPAGDVELVPLEGRGSMAARCEPFPGKRVVMVTVNTEFFAMFTNWLDAARRFLQETEHLHIVAEDDQAGELIESFLKDPQWNFSELSYSVASPSQPASALVHVPFGEKAYGRLVWKRPEHILELLHVGCSVLYVDVDTVWRHDPFFDIQAAGNADLYLTDDDPKELVPNLCTCFMLLHPTAAAVALLQSWAAAAHGVSNQKVFNDLLAQARASDVAPRTLVLPVTKFPPGKLVLHPNNWDILRSAPPDPTVWHANWRHGIEQKVHFFEVLRWWKPANITA